MKTNIELVNGTYCACIAWAEFCAGITEEGVVLCELCDVYRAIDGTVFAYDHIQKEVVKDYVVVSKPFPSSLKRSRRGNSNNKKAYRLALAVKCGFVVLAEDLPF